MILQGLPIEYGINGMFFSVAATDAQVASGWRKELMDRFKPAFGVTTVYKFNVVIPWNWLEDSQACIVAQWHSSEYEPVGLPPPLAFEIKDGNWRIVSRYDVNKISTISPDDDGRKTLLWTEPFVREQWEQFSVSVKWGWAPVGDPLTGWIEVSRNGVVLFQKYGPNCYNDVIAPYFKCGIYVWQWGPIAKSRAIYFKF